jgi:hypothetical protein
MTKPDQTGPVRVITLTISLSRAKITRADPLVAAGADRGGRAHTAWMITSSDTGRYGFVNLIFRVLRPGITVDSWQT